MRTYTHITAFGLPTCQRRNDNAGPARLDHAPRSQDVALLLGKPHVCSLTVFF